MTTLHLEKSISRSPLRRGLLLIALALCSFALSPVAQAVSPAPDGGYAGNNTAEGDSALFSLTSGTDNTGLGSQALFHETTGNYNTASGYRVLFSNTTGSQNTASGINALSNNTIGSFNTATGVNTLYRNTTGGYNTATGVQALFSNTTGYDNTATGFQALQSNTTGFYNMANGFQALYSNTSGSENTAVGVVALYNNTTASDNTATGFQALYQNTIGNGNTATGYQALYSNTTGFGNTANGGAALGFNTTGSDNTANGSNALGGNTTGNDNTATGVYALGRNTTGSENIALGIFAGLMLTTGNNNIDIGNDGAAADDSTIRIGIEGIQTATFIAGIYGVNEGGTPLAVYINSNGQLGTMSSSRRFKKEIRPMNQTSEAILALHPVTFQYKSDAKDTAQFGLIAEEVAQVDPDLVARDAEGKVYTVRYDAVNAMLLNEFLKEHKAFVEEHRRVENLEAIVAKLSVRLDAQDAKIQKVSAELALQKNQANLVAAINSESVCEPR